ncbi:MAG TPA: hypothetical protein VJM08_09205 [Anaerolineales bacterium]|nr:hypothetical protein [Anaerolineales bacterium]
MTTLAIPTGESALQKESNLFRELFVRLGNALLNRIFDLKPESAARRLQNLTILLFLIWFLISLRYYPLALWAQYLQEAFLFVFNPSFYAQAYGGNGITKFVFFAMDALTDPHVFQYFPIFLASFFIALQSAAIYLADVFELEDVGVARKFVWSVALSGSNEVIRVTQGDISDVSRESPAFLIGGPGMVVVDLDSVALFEKSNGIPHIIGPGAAMLDGFERFRQAIDIRDHYVDLRDQDPKSQSVKSRSRDGIPITATDVRLMFSIYRGDGAKPSTALPYPFSKEAVQQIIYKASSRVTPDLPNPSTYEFSWINNMIGLIRGKLGGFMSQHNLTVYLASIGIPEFEKAKKREESIAEHVQQLTQSTEEPNNAKEVRPPPKFTPRYEITNLFTQFAEEFTKSARNSGVELHWIGVGTWKTPVEIVPEKHLEAWKQSQENLKSGSDEVMQIAQEDAIVRKMESLIKSVPFDAYHEIMGYGYGKQSRKSLRKEPFKPKELAETVDDLGLNDLDEDEAEGVDNMLKIIALSEIMKERSSSSAHAMEHRDAMRMLLLEYRKQFIEAIEFMKAKREAVPSSIEEAVKHINGVLGYKHWAGSL